MINIAIVEDEASYAQQLTSFLHRYEAENNEQFRISLFSDGYEIIQNYRPDFDIILLDIQMRYLDGMATAKEIRKTDPQVVIVFITNLAQYAIQGYQVDALDYILKPIAYFAFGQRLARAIARIQTRAKSYVTIHIKSGYQKLDISTIYYVESQGHYLIFHTKDGMYTVPGTMTDIEQKLQPYGFVRGHKGYLINLDYVSGVQDNSVIVNGKALLLSRQRKNAFMQALTDHFTEGSR